MTTVTLSERTLRLPRKHPRTFFAATALLWWVLYKSLVPASEALVAALPIDRRSHLSAAGAVKIERQVMSPQKKFHLVFSLIMGAMMIFVMTFVITLVNVGYSDAFLRTWMKALAVAYVVGVPVIFFLAPVARKLTGGLLGMPQ